MSVTAETVRYYTRIGLLSPDRHPTNDYKIYGQEQQTRLRFVIAARSLGFSLEDIRQILDVADSGKTPCPVVRELIEVRLQEVEQRFQHMAHLRDRMHAAVADWRSKPDKAPTGQMICHLIEGFTE